MQLRASSSHLFASPLGTGPSTKDIPEPRQWVSGKVGRQGWVGKSPCCRPGCLRPWVPGARPCPSLAPTQASSSLSCTKAVSRWGRLGSQASVQSKPETAPLPWAGGLQAPKLRHQPTLPGQEPGAPQYPPLLSLALIGCSPVSQRWGRGQTHMSQSIAEPDPEPRECLNVHDLCLLAAFSSDASFSRQFWLPCAGPIPRWPS